MKKIKKIAVLFLTLIFILGCLSEDDGVLIVPPIQGTILKPNVGGPNQPNQVWINLEDGAMTENRRPDWDLGFYTGDEFAVILNNSTVMAASPVDGYTELSEINSQNMSELMDKVQVANFDPDNIIYVDDIRGNYLDDGVVIDQENKIYLINMGYYVTSGPFSPEIAYTTGTARGWMKAKIFREGDDAYRIQYASLDSTEFIEAVITKDSNYNFSFFSLINDEQVVIQPAKTKWDLCYTVFINDIQETDGSDLGSYIFADFVVTNTMAGTGAYQVITNEASLLSDYNDFAAADVEHSRFVFDDHRAIGPSWRTVPGAIMAKDRFYVLKDSNGKLFKIRFISMSDADGYRGFPVFEYSEL